jgi:addiction module RelE/StbE family toxin
MAKKREILWTDLALSDLQEIAAGLRREKREAAKALATRIRERVSSLRTYPMSGRTLPEFEHAGYRELIVAPYRIIYQVQQWLVVVLRVWHGCRDLRPEAIVDEESPL